MTIDTTIAVRLHQICLKNDTMKLEQIYTNCLAHGAYFLESNGECAIIDPLRDIDGYIDLANKYGGKIKYIFETHFHADFVSGHVDLAKKTGATIIYGPTTMKTGFDAYIAKDGESFQLGALSIQAIHTPGHTLESTCYLLNNENNEPISIFTGDTLFIGDVGRPDLAQHVIKDLTPEMLAGFLFDSLREKLMTLPNHITIFPGHGAGSACGKKMSSETHDTLGNQKKTNYALRSELTKEEFIKELLHGLTPPPSYFPKNVLMNIHGYENMDQIMKRGLKPLTVESFSDYLNEKYLIIDTRAAEPFSESFIPGSMNIGLNGSFAVWAGTLISNIEQPFLIVADPGKEKESLLRLSRVGYDGCVGYLDGGITAWQNAGKATQKIQNISAQTFIDQLHILSENQVLDVRKNSEFEAQHLSHTTNLPLDYLLQHMTELDPKQHYTLFCAGGYRSMIAASILAANGFRFITNVSGGFNEIKKIKNAPVTEEFEPITLL